MSYKISCPECQKTLKVGAEHAGKLVRCPYCQAKLRVPSPEPDAAGEPQAGPAPDRQKPSDGPTQPPKVSPPTMPQPDRESPAVHVEDSLPSVTPPAETPSVAARRAGRLRPKSRGRAAGASAAGTDVSLLWSGALALAATAALYVAVLWPLRALWAGRGTVPYVIALFTDRGWVPYVIVVLASWSVAILVLKWRKVAQQQASLLLDALPDELGKEIRPKDAVKFRSHIEGLPGEWRRSFFVSRVDRALEHFLARGSVQEVATMLNSQAEIDAGVVQSSYTMVKAFVWAIPILGFIGTVLGIGAAVGGFSEAIQGAQEMDVIKTSLTSVTSGLALAFDTTLLALIFSVGIMLPASGMQKREEDLLASVDEYCNETLLPRLDDGRREGPSNAEEIKAAMAEALAEQESRFQHWHQQLGAIGETVTRQVVEGWQGVHGRLQESQQERIRQVFESAASERDAFVAQLKTTGQEQLKRTDEVVTALSDTAGRIHREIARFEEDQVRKMLDAVATLTDDREGIKRQAEQQLAAVSEIGRELVGSISESQLKLAERLSAITSLLEGQKALASIQENLVHNLALLNDSEVYQRTLLTLEQLRPVLERLGIRSDGEVIVAKPARAWWHFWRR
jgi:hypothetical protein